MSFFLLHAPVCAPDAGIYELPYDHRPYQDDLVEVEHLLQIEEVEGCQKCSRKRRRTSFDAYPEKPLAPTYLARCQVSQPKPRGCRRLLQKISHLFCCARSRRRYKLLTRYRYYQQKKPYSSISVHIENLTSETYDEDDLAGVPDLLEVIKLQATGSTEAARALRKKLKYGSVHRQLRALTILDGLLQNGGQRMQRSLLSDPPLSERLRIAAVDPVSDPDVRAKCKDLFSQWVASSKEQPGLEGAKSLYNQLPKTRKPQQQRREQSKVLRETEEDARRYDFEDEQVAVSRSRSGSINPNPTYAESSSPNTLRKQSVPILLGPSSTFSSKKVKKDKKNKGQRFNLEREKPQILNSIAASSVASTNLNNALKLVNREHRQVSNDAEVMKRFETCKMLRRQILRYIQLVETDEFLGALIQANEELISGLMAFEILDKSVDDDSDSELEEAQHLSRQQQKSDISATRDAEKMVAGLSIEAPAKPPRPQSGSGPPRGLQMPPPRPVRGFGKSAKRVESDESDSESDAEDEDDPFGDSKAMKTPEPERVGAGGRRGYGFREV